jgi:AcrR family transcriptional regulator
MHAVDLKSISAQLEQFLWPEKDPKLKRKRERILLAAIDLFVRLGYRKTSVEAVAQQAGIAKGTVYLYYGNKAELAYHAIAHEKIPLIEGLAMLDTNLSAQAQLQALLALGLVMSRELPLYASLLQGDREFEIALQEIDAPAVQLINEMQAAMTGQLLDAATSHTWSKSKLQQRVELLTDMMFALAASQHINLQGLAWNEYASAMAGVMINGLISEADNPEEARSDLAGQQAVAGQQNGRAS